MVQKGSYLTPADKNGVWKVGIVHLYGGFYKKKAFSGSFLKVSVKKIKTNNWALKKSMLKSLIMLTRKEIYSSSIYFKFKINSCILLKKRLNTLGPEVYGPSLKTLKRKKLIYMFSGVL